MSGPLLANVPNDPADAVRAQAMLGLLDTVLGMLDGNTNAKMFLLRVAWHEGARLRARRQGGGGPALSFFQFEAHRARDAGDYARAKGLVPKIAQLCADTEAALNGGIAALPLFDAAHPNQSARFPAGNLIGTLLETYDAFGIALARIAFKKVPAAVPSTIEEQAQYWYTYWKVSGGDPAVLRARFAAEARELDTLLL